MRDGKRWILIGERKARIGRWSAMSSQRGRDRDGELRRCEGGCYAELPWLLAGGRNMAMAMAMEMEMVQWKRNEKGTLW